MHEDSRTIKSIDWRAVFPFLNLFRAFGIALHPSKLFLGLAMILVVYGAGRSLDFVWARLPGAVQYELAQFPSSSLPLRADEYHFAPKHSGPFDVFMNFQLSRLKDLTAAARDLSLGELGFAVQGFVLDGPAWLFGRHVVLALLLSVATLLSWAVFGGAIARVAAVQVARDAKISMRNALRFSSGKLLSFLCAPVILALFICGLGLLIAVVNLLFYIPVIGPIAVGAGFIFTLAAGFVLTLAAFGSVGGFGLLYPTVAVEGTDSFDAISRSFSYLFARPGKLLGYTLVSIVYGALTFLVVKLFVVTMVGLVQWFQAWLLNDPHAIAYHNFFPGGSMEQLSYDVHYDDFPGGSLRATGLKLGAGMAGLWYHLIVGLVGAYAVSFYFSANTIIYSLLRLEVDATELDDVYLEDSDDEELLEANPPATDEPLATGGRAETNAKPEAPGDKTEDEKPEDEKGEQPATFSSAPPLP